MQRSLLKRTRLIPLLLLLVALIAAACGDGSENGLSNDTAADIAATDPVQTNNADDRNDPEDAASPTSTTRGDAKGSYANQAKRIVDSLQENLDEVGLEFLRLFLLQLYGVDTEDEQEVAETLTEVLLTFADDVTGLISKGLEELDALTLPDRFVKDHRLFVSSVRGLASVQTEAFEKIASEGFDLQASFEARNAETDALEAKLQAALTPEFLVLVDAFFSDANLSNLTLLDILGEDDSVTLTQDEGVDVSIGGNLVNGFPPNLAPPDSTLETSASERTDSGTLYFAAWQSNHDPMDLLNFFENIFEALGIDEEPEQTELDGLYTLQYGDSDPERSLATVFIAANEEIGGYSVVMQYLDPP